VAGRLIALAEASGRGEGTSMDASRQYRQQEVVCLRLASEASENYVKVALTELAADFHQKAEQAKRRHQHATRDWVRLTLGASHGR